MGRDRVYTACRDCKRCTNSRIADGGRKLGRAALAFTTMGISEVGFAAKKKCRMCGHQMSLHHGSIGALPVQVIGPVEVKSPASNVIESEGNQKMTKNTVPLTGDGWPMVEPLPKKEAALLASTLTSSETILGQLVGQYHQTVVATASRLIVAKSGMMVDSMFGGKCTSFDYANITAVEIRTTLAQGYFEITAGGMTLPNAKGLEKSIRQQELPNVVTFYKSERERWDLFAGKVREISYAMRSGTPSSKATATNASIPEMISQLAQLHEAGILSDEEFAEKKADLLSRM